MGNYAAKGVEQEMERRGYDPKRGTHGTAFVEGMTTVDPGEVVGRNNWPGLSRSDRAYYTSKHPNDPDYAEHQGWMWAQDASSPRGDKHVTSGYDVRSRPVVHHVEAEGTIDEDPILNKGGRTGAELTADRLKIVDTDWIPHPPLDFGAEPHKNANVVQGTLPNYNWNKTVKPVDDRKDSNWVTTNTRLEREVRINRERAQQEDFDWRRQHANDPKPGQLSMNLGSQFAPPQRDMG